MKLRKYTLEQLTEAVKTSTSYRQVLSKINLAPKGSNYKTLKKAIEYFNLDDSHFLGRRSNLGKKFGFKRPIKDYLENKHPIQSYKLKNRLLKEGLLERKCMNCLLEDWKDQPIALELHHIDGDPKNNSLENLQLLCPNCHAFTNNYRAKNSS